MEKKYANLFWDYPEIEALAKNLSKEEFKQWISQIKYSSPIKYKVVLRRFLERAYLIDLFYFFEINDIKKALDEFRFWKMSPVRIHAIKHSIELLKNSYD